MGWGITARRFVIMAALCVSIIVAAPAAAQEQTGGTIHVVQRGETLFSIARQWYGEDGHNVTVLFEANRFQLQSPNLIYVGQVLRVDA